MLSNLGNPENVRRELQVIIDGPTLATRAEVSALLARLSYHYWRPDFTPQQAVLVIDDFIRDLSGGTACELADACDDYRRNPKNRFFPTPGQLIAIVRDKLLERDRLRRGAQKCLDALDGNSTEDVEQAFTGPRDFASLRSVFMAGKGLDVDQADDLPPPDAARSETPESSAELRATLARRKGGANAAA